MQKSESATTEKNRAAAAAMNAEVRRTKARLMEELPKLKKLAHKKVNCLYFFLLLFFSKFIHMYNLLIS